MAVNGLIVGINQEFYGFPQKCTWINSLHKTQTRKTHRNYIGTALKPYNRIQSSQMVLCQPTIEFSFFLKPLILSHSQTHNINWPRAKTTGCRALDLSENIRYFSRHEPFLFWLLFSLCTIACPLFYLLHRLIFIPVDISWGVKIPQKVWNMQR